MNKNTLTLRAALARCKGIAEDTSMPPSARLELIRDCASMYAGSPEPTPPQVQPPALPAVVAVLQDIACRMDRWKRAGIAAGPQGRDADWYQLMARVMAALELAEGR